MENRLSSYHYRQVEDSTNFLLMRAKVQGRQLANANGLAQLNDNIRKNIIFMNWRNVTPTLPR